MTVLDEDVPFLEGETLAEGQNDSYFQPRVSETQGDALRALRARP